jgi:hypothetical protein
MIDEKAKRKPNFTIENSVPVSLGDEAQTWYLPKPWLEVWPIFRDGAAVRTLSRFTHGPELDEMVEVIAEAEGAGAQICAAASLAARLLRHHYELTDRELDELLRFRLSDPASRQWIETTIEVATGQNGPKLSRAGDG